MQINQKTELVIRKAKVEVQGYGLRKIRNSVLKFQKSQLLIFQLFVLSDATAVVWKKAQLNKSKLLFSILGQCCRIPLALAV